MKLSVLQGGDSSKDGDSLILASSREKGSNWEHVLLLQHKTWLLQYLYAGGTVVQHEKMLTLLA